MMRKPSLRDIKPSVRSFAAELAARWPKLGKSLRVKRDGHFEAVMAAPNGSQVRALICLSSGKGDVWLGFEVPQAFYPVESTPELVKVVDLLLTDAVVFAIARRGTSWTGTTLVAAGRLPELEPGETCHLYSWSGKTDLVVTRPGPRRARSRTSP